ncbi:MAG TPA: agmatine deiminase, partial [Gammaproteobacteria bacterium]|nr:agmatine deiminase [Gammaproteobacteria bacterium]
MNLNLSEAASVGFHMPAEWQNHSQCWMAWPCREGFNSEATCLNYAEVAKTISRFEPVSMVVHPQDREAAQTVLGSQINCVEIPIDDGWFRDNGPNFLVNDRGDVAGACFGFNAWGGNYEPFEDDAQAAPRLMS